MKRYAALIAVLALGLAVYLLWPEPPEPRTAGPLPEIAEQREPAQPTLAEPDPPPQAPVSNAMQEEAIPAQETPEELADGTFQVRGRVQNASGQPVAGAELFLFHDSKTWGLDDAVVDKTVSDEDGTFFFPALVSFDRDVNHSYAQDVFVIFARHGDYGMSWENVVPAPDHSNYVVTLREAMAKTLTIVDPEGTPIEGARVWPYHFGERESPHPEFRDYINLRGELAFAEAYSDRDGRVTFTNLPPTTVSFHATKDGYARGIAFSHSDTIVLTPGVTVSGRVTTKRGEPVAGATVVFAAETWNNYIRARTDADGRYEARDMPGEGFDMSTWRHGQTFVGRYQVSLKSDAYAMESFPLHVQAGDVIEDLDLVVEPGVRVRCRVIDEMGNAVSGVRLHGRNEGRRIGGFSGSDGIFEVTVLPGNVFLRMTSPPEGVYYSERPHEAAATTFVAEGDITEVTMRIPSFDGFLTSLTGDVELPPEVDPASVTVFATSEPFHHSGGGGARPAGVNADGTFELRNVPTGRDIVLYAVTEDGLYGGLATVNLPENPDHNVRADAELEPTLEVETYVEDTDGHPASGVRVSVAPVVDGQWIPRASARFVVGEDGRLRFPGALPGVEYRIQADREETPAALDNRDTPLTDEDRIRLRYRVYTTVYVEP